VGLDVGWGGGGVDKGGGGGHYVTSFDPRLPCQNAACCSNYRDIISYKG